jgi:glutathione S-transferase
MSTPPAQQPKPRLWVLDWGLFPRRVLIYLKEKGIRDDFEIIPVVVSHDGAAHSPGKPPGTLPVLEIERESAEDKLDGTYIFQSTAILEYLEDVYADHKPNMRGATPKDRARVRECMDIMNEAVTCLGMYTHNASALFAGHGIQDEATAMWAGRRYHKLLDILENLADPKGPFLANVNDQPTIVDCVLLATAQFGRVSYRLDLLSGHERLKICVDAFERRLSGKARDLTKVMPEVFAEKARVLSVDLAELR